jgi:hypothetical protein
MRYQKKLGYTMPHDIMNPYAAACFDGILDISGTALIAIFVNSTGLLYMCKVHSHHPLVSGHPSGSTKPRQIHWFFSS